MLPGRPGKPQIAATYDYRDEAGELLFQVVRLDPKDFRQRRPDGRGGWLWKLDGARRVPYRLSELLAADPAQWVFIVEGEKDADRLAILGLTATTNPGGAGKWKHLDHETVNRALADRHVCLIKDNDEPGEDHVADVAGRVLAVADTVRILRLPGLPEKGDVSDWLDAGGTVEELLRLAQGTTPLGQDWQRPGESADEPAADGWPDPIPLIEDPAIPAFPLDVLPRPLWLFARSLAWALNAPEDFVGTAMLALAAGTIGNARRLRLSATQFQPALIYAAIVGLPGTAKSPVLKFLCGPLDDIQAGFNDAYIRELEEWKDKWGDDEEKKRPKPQLKLVIARNVTTESLALALHHNPRGVAVPFDELTGLFSGFNQYKSGVGNDRQFYLSVWAQETISALRKSDLKDGVPPIFVINPCVSIVGGVQPDLLAAIRGRGGRRGELPPDDGGLDRFLFSWPATLPDVADEPKSLSQGSLRLWPAIIRKLVNDLGDGEAVLTDDGRAAWMEFTRTHAAEVNGGELPDHLRGPWAKLKAYCARLALTLHLLGWAAGDGSDPSKVTGETIRRSAKLIDYFKANAKKVHGHIGADTRVEYARKVVRWIRDCGLKAFSKRDVYQGVRGTLKTVEELAPILKLLEDHYLIREAERPERAPGKSTRGRKPSPIYEVNPKLPTDPDPGCGNCGNCGSHFREPPEWSEVPDAPTSDMGSGSHNSRNSQNSDPEKLFGGEDIGPMR